MHLRYDEDFVEAAVMLCTSGRRSSVAPLQVARFHRARERLYAILEPDDRNAAFFKLHLEWFREWGLEKLLIEPLQEFSLLPQALAILAFRQSRGKNDEGAELYVNDAGDRSAVISLRPDRLERRNELAAYMRHELSHLQDMVDPRFGYAPHLEVLGASLGQQRLARERYRLVWDATIDGRLSRAGRATVATRAERWLEFSAAFPFWTDAQQHEVFDALWADPMPTHHRLQQLVCDPRQLRSQDGPKPGALCPLCGFPTFSWADAACLEQPTITTIKSEFPHWSSEQGACGRCVAIYRLNRGLLPSMQSV
jgi:hypothetical protein